MAKYPYPDAVYSDELELLCMRVEILQEKTAYSRRLLEITTEEENDPPTKNLCSDMTATTVTNNASQEGRANRRVDPLITDTRHTAETHSNVNPVLRKDDGFSKKKGVDVISKLNCHSVDVEEGPTGKQFRNLVVQDMHLNVFYDMDLPDVNIGGTVMKKDFMNSLDGGYNSQSSDDDSDNLSGHSSVYLRGVETSTPQKNFQSTPRKPSHHENMLELEKLLDDITSWDEINANDTLPYKMNASIGSNEVSEPKRESIISSILASSEKDLRNVGTTPPPNRESVISSILASSEKDLRNTDKSRSVSFVPSVKVNDDPVKLNSESSEDVELGSIASDETLTVEKLLAEVREWQEQNDPEFIQPKTRKFTDPMRDVVTIDLPLDKHGRYDSGSLQTLIRECTESFIKVRVPSDLNLNDLNFEDEEDSVFEARTERPRALAEYFV